MKSAVVGLLTGPVGVGKTTIIERVVGLARSQGIRCGGLLSPAIKNPCGQKVGIWGVDILTGERRIQACTDRDLGGPTIGPYSFDAGALDWALEVLEKALGACDLLIVDEVGKMELWQGIGLAPIVPRLAAGEANRALVLVRDHLLTDLQNRLGSIEQRVFTASLDTRDSLPAQVLSGMV